MIVGKKTSGARPIFIEGLILGHCRDKRDTDVPMVRARSSPLADPGHLKCPGMIQHRKQSDKVYAITVCRCPCHAPVYKRLKKEFMPKGYPCKCACHLPVHKRPAASRRGENTK